MGPVSLLMGHRCGSGRRRQAVCTRRSFGSVWLVAPQVGLGARQARFSEANVTELVAAMGAGRLTTTEITALTRAFLVSEHAVRLVDRDTTAGRQRLPRYSTPHHLALERQ